MIKDIKVCMCDVCGKMVAPKRNAGGRNDEYYTPPDGWSKGAVGDIDICEDCTRLLHQHKPNIQYREVSKNATD